MIKASKKFILFIETIESVVEKTYEYKQMDHNLPHLAQFK